jgi:probable rRNA maturation factor
MTGTKIREKMRNKGCGLSKDKVKVNGRAVNRSEATGSRVRNNRDGTVSVYFKRKMTLPYDVKSGVMKILDAEGRRDCWVNVIFASGGLVKMINTEYRMKNRDTDVIAFEFKGERYRHPGGDVFISVDTAKENAKKYGVTPAQEAAGLIVHGTLHVIGYDHLNKKDEREMKAKTEKYMKYFVNAELGSGKPELRLKNPKRKTQNAKRNKKRGNRKS